MSEQNKKQSGGFNPIGLCMGVGVGLCFGVAMGNMGLGIALGMGVGLCYCVALGQHAAKPENQEEDHSGEEKK